MVPVRRADAVADGVVLEVVAHVQLAQPPPQPGLRSVVVRVVVQHVVSQVARAHTRLDGVASDEPVVRGILIVVGRAGGHSRFPVQGMTTARGAGTGLAAVIDVVRHLVLPVVTLAVLQLALVTRLTRSSLREALAEDYARASRAKTKSQSSLVLKYFLNP